MPSPFVAVGATPADTAPIINAPFFPDIDPDEARGAMKLDGTVTPARLRNALITAIGEANGLLATWAFTHIESGHATLADVPAQQIDGASLKVHQYKIAVFALATAQLTEAIRTIDTSRQGNQAADTLEQPIDTHRRNAHWMLNDIRGIPRTTVELI